MQQPYLSICLATAKRLNTQFNLTEWQLIPNSVVAHTFEQEERYDPFDRGLNGGTSSVLLNRRIVAEIGSPVYNLSGRTGIIYDSEWVNDNWWCVYPIDGFSAMRPPDGCNTYQGKRRLTSTQPASEKCSQLHQSNGTCAPNITLGQYWQTMFNITSTVPGSNFAQCSLTPHNDPTMIQNIMTTVSQNITKYNTWCKGPYDCLANNELRMRTPCRDNQHDRDAILYLFVLSLNSTDFKGFSKAYLEADKIAKNLSATLGRKLPVVGIRSYDMRSTGSPFFCPISKVDQPITGKVKIRPKLVDKQQSTINISII